MKVLVNTPNVNALGGVANHYLGLKTYWSENVKYNSLGSKRWRKILLPVTILKFIFKLIFFNPDVVILNPSLGYGALKRDFFYQNLAKLFGCKVVIFIHGFNLDYAEKINKEWAVKNFNKASMIFVLANNFKDIMQDWGVTTSICLTTTKVDDALIEGSVPEKDKISSGKNILFLSRIEKAKGVYEAVDTFAILKPKYKNLTLTFVGDGSELEALKKYVQAKGLSGIRFTGRLQGEELKNEYKNSLLFLLLTTHGEGMPTVVLEAMAFGLPIFTRKIGGLVDFFENEKMGFISDSLDPKDFAEAMIPFIENRELEQKVSQYNTQYAKEHFMASSVAKQLENTIKEKLKL